MNHDEDILTPRPVPGAAERAPEPRPVEPIDGLLGSWDVEVDFFFFGTDHRMMAFGVAEALPLMGGRYVRLAVNTRSDAIAHYHAVIVLGRNDVTGRFESIIFDNTVTSMVVLEGEYDAARRCLDERGEHTNPALGCRHALRTKWLFAEPNEVELLVDASFDDAGAWKHVMRVGMRRRT